MRFFFMFSLVFLVAACDQPGNERTITTLSGKTMGTTYQVKAVNLPKETAPDVLAKAVEASLTRVNNSMSNWVKTSEISVFNAKKLTDPVPMSGDLAAVMAEAFRIHEESKGRFDVTLAPLINLWGFGPAKKTGESPSDEAIAKARAMVGMTRLLRMGKTPATLAKTDPSVTINLSAIAKGYGVDQVAAVLEKHGVSEYLVEIGGDLLVKGRNAQNKPWTIGIETPDASGRSVFKVLPVSDIGLATSGDYRNFIEKDGKRLSHIIDPVTGHPVKHRLASVTILSKTAMRADGLATALLVLGEEAGLALANELNIAALFIIRGQNGYETLSSKAFLALNKQK